MSGHSARKALASSRASGSQPEQAADGFGLGAFRVVRVVADGVAGVVAEEQLQGGPFGEDGDLDGVEASQLALPRREQDAAAERQRAGFGTDRPGELGGVLEVVEDEQGVGPLLEFLEGGLELPVGGLADGLGPQPGPDLGESLGERLGGVDPEDAAGVVRLVAVDVLDGELGLADAAHAGQPGGPDADGLPFLEDVVEGFEVVGAADEVGVPGERHEERNRARRGPLPSPRRAYRKLSRASRMAARPGPVELSAQRMSSAACSGTVPWRLTCEAAPSTSVTKQGHVAGAQPGHGSHEGRPVDGPSLCGGRRRHDRGGRSRGRGILCPGREARDGLADAPGDVRERLVPVLPRRDRLAVLGQGLELPERGGVPVAPAAG